MQKLPVIAAFVHSIESTIGNIRFAFHASWLWMLLLLPLNIAGNIYILSFGVLDPQNVPWQVSMTSLVMGLCAMLAFASIAVNWHRYILRDEVPLGMQRLRLDNLVMNYFGNTLLIGLMLVLVSIAFFIPIGFLMWMFSTFSAVAVVFGGIAGFIAFIFVLGLSVRWSLKLVAVAMGRSDVRISDAWRKTIGNHWQIAGLVVLVFTSLLVVALVFAGVTYGFGRAESAVALSALIFIQMAVNWLATIWNVTLLTSLYGYFFEDRKF